LKTNRSLWIGVAALLLFGCSLRDQTISPSNLAKDPTPRATLPAVPALSSQMPSFDGLYFTSDLLVESHGENIRILADLPCGQVIALLSSSQWLLTKDIPLDPKFAGFIPGFTLLERNGEYLLLKSREIVPEAPPMPGVEQAATAIPTAQATPGGIDLNSLIGCQVTVAKIIPQPLEAHGVEEVQGLALGYQVVDCLYTPKEIGVNMYYEGQGDFRANLMFQVPNAIGEQPVSLAGLSLQVLHHQSSVLEYVDQLYRNWDPANSNPGSEGITFTAGSETPGTVTVRSLEPLAGEIQLDNLMDAAGNLQTFKAAFDCGW